MLEKKVIKHTRNGIERQNLVTGATEQLTKSEFARQTHYQSPNVHHLRPTSNTTKPNPAVFIRPSKKTQLKTPSGLVAIRPSANAPPLNKPVQLTLNNPTAKTDSVSTALSAQQYQPRLRGRLDRPPPSVVTSSTPTSLALRNPKQNARFSTNTISYGKNKRIRPSYVLGKYLLRDTERELKQSDDVGLQAVGEYSYDIHSAVQAYYDVQRLRYRYARGKAPMQPQGAPDSLRLTAAKQAAARQQVSLRKQSSWAKGYSHTAKPLQHNFGEILLNVVKSVLPVPGAKTLIAIAAGILFVLMVTTQTSGLFVNAFIGATIEHPELSEFVMELDAEFQQRVSEAKERYADDSNTTVSIKGDGFVDTDANALAILVTKDWTILELDESSKQQLRKYHSALNSFTTEKESDTDEIIMPDGTISYRTTYHVTINVHIFTAEEKLGALGFSQTEETHIREMLDILQQISDPTSQYSGVIITDGQGMFTWPVPDIKQITSPFGMRWGKAHKGIDISGYQAYGKPIVAAADGIVTQAIHSGWGGGYGLCAYIDHGNGYSSRYGHCSKVLVNKGDTVKKGQVIALIGSSGDSTGAHLHFEIRKNGIAVNPQQFYKQ